MFNRTVALKDTWSKAARIVKHVSGPLPAKSEAKSEAAPAAARPAKPEKEAEELSPEALALRDAHGLGADDARILAGDAVLRGYFTQALAAGAGARAVANWVVNDVGRELKLAGAKGLPFGGEAVGELVALLEAGTISGKIAKDVFAELVKDGGSPKAIVQKRGIEQISDTGAVEAAVDATLAENAPMVARYRAGNANLLGALVGLVIKKTGGKANPKLVNEALRQKLGATS